MALRTNIWTMSKVDNNNNYDYDLQASNEKHMGGRRYIIPGTKVLIRSLVIEFGSEV